MSSAAALADPLAIRRAGPDLLSLALIESLVIYSLVISFILSGKL